MHRGKLVAARRGAVVVMVFLGLCTAGQAVSPPPASAQTPCTGTAQAPCGSLADTFNNIGISDTGSTTRVGNFDGGNFSLSRQALARAGVSDGVMVTAQAPGGPPLSFTWRDVGGGAADNTLGVGQYISISGAGTLGFLLTGTNTGSAPFSGPGTVYFTDGTSEPFALTAWDWCGPPTGEAPVEAIIMDVRNQWTGSPASYVEDTGCRPAMVYYESVSLPAGEVVDMVRLPTGSPYPITTAGAMHIFGLAALPAPPANVTATTALGTKTATITWTPSPTTTPGVTGYIATAYLNGEPAGTCSPTPLTGTSCAIPGLTNGETYTVTVVANNASGTSPPSTPATVTPLASTGSTIVTFTVLAGSLIITVPNSVDFGEAPAGTYLTGSLGQVTVTDGRPADVATPGTWEASVDARNFVLSTCDPDTGVCAPQTSNTAICASAAACTIPAAGNVTYTIPTTGPDAPDATVTTGADAVFTNSTPTVITAAEPATFPVLSGVNAGITNWNPTIGIRIPGGTQLTMGDEEYAGTITHSVL